MITNTAERIIQYITGHKEVTPRQLREYLGIGAPALFRQLKKLQIQGKITKTGSSPKVFYSLTESGLAATVDTTLPKNLAQLIEQRWLSISVLGQIEAGLNGFAGWCHKFKLPVAKTALEYQRILLKYDQYKKGGVLNGLPKITDTFAKVYLDELYYLDFYSIERFGKTKLGALLLYAKQSQSSELMKRLFDLVRPKIQRLIIKKKIEAVGFIPPTVQRLTQLQRELEKNLALELPTLKIVKASGTVAVAQKTLSKLPDRVVNAAGSIFVESIPKGNRILLIDDAVGSGASMNETARKIKEKNSRAHVIGLAITGSYKGFDVLNEV
ncbi:MAG: hypothetical protein Q7K33_02600 [Candidatus Berkelbacteria bacterium]|nr:hypothetical protein [Candidatus Berkelbacteria bacterium]